MTPKTQKKVSKKPGKTKKVEHVIQVPLMDGCFLCLQVNDISGSRWTLGFPNDKVAYPISEEVAQTLATMAKNKVPAGWVRRELSAKEVAILQEEVGCLTQLAESLQQPATVSTNVDQFVSDVGAVWSARQPAIMELVHKLNDALTSLDVPVLDAILSLCITMMMGAATVGASGPHLAELFNKLVEHIELKVEHVPFRPIAGESN